MRRRFRTRSVQRQPRQIAGAAAGVAVSRQVKRVGELPFLRLVAPLNGRRTGDVVGLTVGANRRGSRGPGFVMSRGRGRLRRLLEWIAKQSKSQDAPPIVPVSTTQHNFGRFGCLHARRNCLCIPPVLLIRKTARVWAVQRARITLRSLRRAGRFLPAGTVFPAKRLFSRRASAGSRSRVLFLSAPRCRLLRSSSILLPGDTVWRRCKAGRLAILNDAAAYFAALREALLLATQQVYIIGWDIHSQTRLVGPSGHAEDGFPEQLGPFLKALLKARAGLRIDILSWNFAALYAAEREWNSARKFTSGASGRLRFCFELQPSPRFCPAPEDRRH